MSSPGKKSKGRGKRKWDRSRIQQYRERFQRNPNFLPSADERTHESAALMESILHKMVGHEERWVWKLQRQWEGILGTPLAHHCKPTGFRFGCLYVAVEHPIWFQELRRFEHKILENISRAFPEHRIRKIQFQLGTYDEKDTPT